MLRIFVSLQDTPTFRQFGPTDNAIQLPEFGSRGISVTQTVREGETLVLSGFTDRVVSNEQEGFVGATNPLAGATLHGDRRFDQVLLVTSASVSRRGYRRCRRCCCERRCGRSVGAGVGGWGRASGEAEPLEQSGGTCLLSFDCEQPFAELSETGLHVGLEALHVGLELFHVGAQPGEQADEEHSDGETGADDGPRVGGHVGVRYARLRHRTTLGGLGQRHGAPS